MNVDADARRTEAACVLTKHLALARGEIEMALSGREPADVADQQHLIERQRIEDCVIYFGDLVKAMNIDHNGTLSGCRTVTGTGPNSGATSPGDYSGMWERSGSGETTRPCGEALRKRRRARTRPTRHRHRHRHGSPPGRLLGVNLAMKA